MPLILLAVLPAAGRRPGAAARPPVLPRILGLCPFILTSAQIQLRFCRVVTPSFTSWLRVAQKTHLMLHIVEILSWLFPPPNKPNYVVVACADLCMAIIFGQTCGVAGDDINGSFTFEEWGVANTTTQVGANYGHREHHN